MGCNKFRRAQQIPDVFENSGMDFEFFPYYEIFRFSNEDGQGRIIDYSLSLMALVWGLGVRNSWLPDLASFATYTRSECAAKERMTDLQCIYWHTQHYSAQKACKEGTILLTRNK